LVQIGTFISFADDSIVEDVIIVVVWADAFVSTGVVEAGGWCDASSVVHCAFIDINASVQIIRGSVPCCGVVFVAVVTVQSGQSNTGWLESCWADEDSHTTGQHFTVSCLESTKLNIISGEGRASWQVGWVWAGSDVAEGLEAAAVAFRVLHVEVTL